MSEYRYKVKEKLRKVLKEAGFKERFENRLTKSGGRSSYTYTLEDTYFTEHFKESDGWWKKKFKYTYENVERIESKKRKSHFSEYSMS